jgi:hypothetical protein
MEKIQEKGIWPRGGMDFYSIQQSFDYARRTHRCFCRILSNREIGKNETDASLLALEDRAENDPRSSSTGGALNFYTSGPS